jgi:sulfatase maturation enzyme AslB (radical SAM superfamily)
MYCARLDHFVRFNANGSVSRCGHMVDAPEFKSLEEMESSEWLIKTKKIMLEDRWPKECVRCEETEPRSIRHFAEQLDRNTQQKDYLQVGGVLDNLCNAACQSCNENLSTRIGSLKGRIFPLVDNLQRYQGLPRHRIVHLDINGGEPSYSKNYKKILNDLPPNLKTLRLNTNGSRVLTELIDIARRGIEVTVTVSCDGIGSVHEYVRWPIPWQQFYDNLMIYRSMPVHLNLWTTVSVLNVHDLPNIQAFAKEHGIDHGWAYLKKPWELAVENTDIDARQAYIRKQKQLRGIDLDQII